MDFMAHYEKSARMWAHGLHAHDYYEIYIHLGGGRYYCVDDQIYELTPGQLLIIPPLHMHGLICDRDLVDYERCYLYLSPELIQKFDFDKINLAGILSSSAEKQKMIFNLSESDADICKKNLQMIENLSESTEIGNAFEIYSRIFQILKITIDNLEYSEIVAPQMVSDNPVIGILHYINDHFTQNITLSSICREFHISESSLSHKFKEHVNKGVYEYILYKRITYAKELIYSDEPLTDVAFKCGFSDYSNFLRTFIKQTGMSPREYKNTI